ncbi:tail fiber protein [Azospirillum sp. Marseille-Q6669]
MSWYKVGRVAVTNGSTTVLGSNTRWSGKLKAGDVFTLDGGRLYEIVSFEDDRLTLATPFAGTSGGALPYGIIQNFTASITADLAARTSNMIQLYEAAVAAPQEALSSSQAARHSEEVAAEHAQAAASSAAQAAVTAQQAVQVETTRAQAAEQALAAQKADKAALGSAAARNAPAGGNAASGEVVLGSDSRLSDARTPTAHSVTAHSDWPAAVSVTELGCLDGVTGPIQAQINGKATVGTTAGSAAGTASAGTAATAARSDHVHPMQTSVSGNAGTATKLASAVTINNVPFDGSAGITINAADSTARIAASEKGAANGVTPLGSDGKVPASYLPSYVDDVLEFSATGNFPASGETGKIYVATGTNKTYRWSGSGYVEISASPGSTDAVPEGAANLYFTTARAAAAAPVKTVAGKSGDVTLSKADVGLGSVDNTADSTKAVASAGKLTAARTITLTGGVTGSVTTDLSSAVSINATVTQDTNNRFVTDAEKAIWNGKATVGSVTPSAPGTAAVGTSGQAARADHVHPAQTSVSGNAGTATKLATARTISLSGGVTGTATFDGSANVAIAATVDPSKHSHPLPFSLLDDGGAGFELDSTNLGYSTQYTSPEDIRSMVGAVNVYDAGCRGNAVGITGLVPLLVDMQVGIGKLDNLLTTDTSSLVNAINELKTNGGGRHSIVFDNHDGMFMTTLKVNNDTYGDQEFQLPDQSAAIPVMAQVQNQFVEIERFGKRLDGVLYEGATDYTIDYMMFGYNDPNTSVVVPLMVDFTTFVQAAFSKLPVYSSNAAAAAGNLPVGGGYRTPTGEVRVRV